MYQIFRDIGKYAAYYGLKRAVLDLSGSSKSKLYQQAFDDGYYAELEVSV